MKGHLRRTIWIAIAATAALVGIVLAYPDIMRALSQPSALADPGIPTSFSGNRLAYGFALFSLFSTTSLAIRKLILIGAQMRAQDWRQDPDVGLYAMAFACLLMVIILGAGPDVILLLLWGEAGTRTMTTVMTLDRMCDGLTIIPFTAAILLHVRATQFERSPSLAELAHLAPEIDVGPRERTLFVVQPRAESIAENVKIVVFVMLIAAGLALWK